MLGIPKDTLRYYDRIGIVSPSRAENRYRAYSKDDLIDLMNIQIMQYADFSLEEIKEKFGFRKMGKLDPAYCEEVAAFIEAKNAETRRKIAHLEKVSRLLDVAAESLRNFNRENDRRLAEYVRGIYEDIRASKPEIMEEGCDDHQD